MALPALLFAVAAALAGGALESTYSLLCAVVWLALALALLVVPDPPRPSAAVAALAALAALSALSGLWGQPGEALRTAPLPALYGGVLFVAEWIGPAALGPLRAALVAAAAAGLVARAAGWAAPAAGQGSVRLAWPVTYANGLGLVCAIGVLLCLDGRRAWRLGAVVCAAALVWTLSRSALAGCLGALVLVAALRGLLPRRASLAGAAALLVLAAVLARPLADRFAAAAPDARDARRLVDVSGNGRTTLWRTALHEGADHPLGGGGAGTWPRSAIAQTHRVDLPADAHSLELQTWAELGIAGLACLGVLLVAVALRAQRGPAVAAAAFALWAVVSATDWDWQLPAATIPALVAAGALAPRRPARLGAHAATGLAAAALAVGVLASLHGLGARALEGGRPTRLLPWDARPWVRIDPPRACRIDPRQPDLTRSGACRG